MSSNLSITSEQILEHRASRKAAGLVGCISNRPPPALDFFGYKDVQSWRPADPMEPNCFCFDCRSLWDSDAAIDLQLLQERHVIAGQTYRELLPDPDMYRLPFGESVPHFRSFSSRVPDVEPLRGPGAAIEPLRGPGAAIEPLLIVDTAMPAYQTFEEIPTSLPAPRHRDVMNESSADRLKKDLSELRARLHADLIPTMDKRRMASCMEDTDVPAFLAEVDAAEAALWAKIKAVDTLLADL